MAAEKVAHSNTSRTDCEQIFQCLILGTLAQLSFYIFLDYDEINISGCFADQIKKNTELSSSEGNVSLLFYNYKKLPETVTSSQML